MERLMESPEERTRMGLNGRTLMLEKFTWKRIADQFIDILRKEDLIG
jgi:glycosyltransferase involved in cell wall biosynthesis